MTIVSNSQIVLRNHPKTAALQDVQPFLNRFHETWPLDELEWVLRPMLHESFMNSARWLSRKRMGVHLSHYVASQFPSRGVQLLNQGGLGFGLDGTNLRRVLEPLIEARIPLAGYPRRQLPISDRRRLAYWTRLANEYAQSLIQAAREEDVQTPASPILSFCLAGARAMTRAEGILDKAGLSALVVATQHAPNMRALIATARRRGIPSTYFPHAPTAANRQYADLPTDFAGLRGIGDVELYRRYGASGDLSVVGNPSVDDINTEPSVLGQTPVLAVSPHPPAVLQDVFRLTASVLGDREILVAPHPRSDLRILLHLMPAKWRLWSGQRTLKLLSRGPSFVIQHSSGVAWEALFLGIPVIEIGYVDTPASYPVIAQPYVLFADSTQSLSAAVEEAMNRSADRQARDELREWASYWCSLVGRRAREACIELIDLSVSHGARQKALLDGWRFDPWAETGESTE
jgi:hypothetical protein